MASVSLLSPPASAPAKNRFYRPELDSLRFFAFFAVFIFHRFKFGSENLAGYHVASKFSRIGRAVSGAGAFGVDLFFVLSAYLITELLLREKREQGELDVKAFYIRRILRIWPLYFAFIALAYLVPALNPAHEFNSRYVTFFILLAGNWSIVAFGWEIR